MAQKIKGKCKYCGKEYTRSYMNKHLSSCKVRQEILAAEKGSRQCGYFELAIYPKYNRDYWLFIEMYICTECFWEGDGFLCEECSKTHACGEEMQLDICNSPRMGVCGYCGSEIYPDQFVPDTEKQQGKSLEKRQ